VRVLAPLPKVALYPAMVLILGFDHSSKIALVAADAVFPILLATWQGTAAAEPKLVWSARAAGCTPRRALFTVVLMAALPVGAHRLPHRADHLLHRGVFGRDDHLDRRARLSAGARGRNFQTVDMFVPLISISILGLTLNAAFNTLRAWLLRGFPEEH
jgi:NitT/TauT family transport system permease protein